MLNCNINKFEDFNLNKDLLKGIYINGFVKPSEIQKKGISLILSGRDCIIQSQSGTGKTATYLISILNQINDNIKHNQCIILVPTKQLAEQVYSVAIKLSNSTKIKTCLSVGGIEIKKNINDIKESQLIIGTVGRIYHFISERIINKLTIKTLVLDEADEMLGNDFGENVKDIIIKLKNLKQICFLSATFDEEIIKFSNSIMKTPQTLLLDVCDVPVATIKQFYINVEVENYKFDVLLDLFGVLQTNQTIIFCNKIITISWLSEKLIENDFCITSIHGEMTHEERNKVVDDFRNGKTKILLTTDLLARGIDIPDVNTVINYDLPNKMETYIHRIGRCGRFNKKGISINLVKMNDQSNKILFSKIKTYYGIEIDEMPEDFEKFLK